MERASRPVVAPLLQLRLKAAMTPHMELRIEGRDPLAVLKLVYKDTHVLAATPIDRYSEDAAAWEIWQQLL